MSTKSLQTEAKIEDALEIAQTRVANIEYEIYELKKSDTLDQAKVAQLEAEDLILRNIIHTLKF